MATVLTLNGGSSSIRFAYYSSVEGLRKLLDGKIERIGLEGCSLAVSEYIQGRPSHSRIQADAPDHRAAAVFFMNWLAGHASLEAPMAVGHRIVHGMQHRNPERITPSLLTELRGLTAYDPDHLPSELELIETAGKQYPEIPQVACFDTAFHRSMPRVATLLPIPLRYAARGVQRYGFHGLSYTFLLSELVRLGDQAATHGRVILAHLGNGASVAAVRNGSCIDTSMSFTPTAGLMMSTRSGDLDPGVISFLAGTEGIDIPAFQKMVNKESGLLGVSETSSDIRDLLERESTDARAADAVAMFCYQVKKWIGSFAAALGGVDTLVFAGGIGENSAPIRSRICDGLEFLGIDIEAEKNLHNAPCLSKPHARVSVRVIATDEESVIAESTMRVLESTTT